jgi:hypothetical protein
MAACNARQGRTDKDVCGGHKLRTDMDVLSAAKTK